MAYMENLNDLLKGLTLKTYEGGAVLMEQDERSEKLFILKEGCVEVLKDDISVCRETQPGAVFGEISALLGVPHSATVLAAEPTACYLIEDASRSLKDHPDLTHHVAQLLARRLSAMTRYLVDLKEQFAQNEDHMGMVDGVLQTLTYRTPRKIDRR